MSYTSSQVLKYIKKIHKKGFSLDHTVQNHAEWELENIPVADLKIASDSDPYNRVLDLDQDHVDSITQQDILSHAIVVDQNGHIIDGNHRAAKAQVLGMKHVPAFVPVVDPEHETYDQFMKRRQTNEVTIDNKDGAGAVPNNQDVDYFGLRVKMKPSMFLRLAAPLGREHSPELEKYIADGGAIGAPFLTISIPQEWDDGDLSKSAKVDGHEGRNRMLAVQKLEGDAPIEVHIFPRYYRARDMTPAFVEKINSGLYAEKSTSLVRGPLFAVATSESRFTDYELAIMEGGHALEEPNRVKEFIRTMYDKYPVWPMDGNQRTMVWGSGEEQQFAVFELKPSLSKKNAVEVAWFAAYPLRQGVGTKAMAELQKQAREFGVGLTLYPWDKGQVSQSKLIKFYKQSGFKPTQKGGKAMAWENINEAITRDKVRAALWHEWQQDGWLDQGEQSPEEMDDEEYNDFEDTVDRIVAWGIEQGITSSQLAVTKWTMASDDYTMSHLLTGRAGLAEASSSLNSLHNKKNYQKTLQVLQTAYGDEEGQQMLDQYIQAVDQLIQSGGTIYRSVWVTPGTKPRLKDAGKHWALTAQAAEEYLDSDAGWGAYADFQGDNDDIKPEPYIISATVGPNSITNKGVLFAQFPEELEVRLVNPQTAKMKIVKKVKGLVPESRLNEGGWASVETQNTVITPRTIAEVMEALKTFESSFNAWQAKQELDVEIKIGGPKGSGTYYRRDLEQDPTREYGDVDVECFIHSREGVSSAQRITEYRMAITDYCLQSPDYSTENGTNIIMKTSSGAVQVDMLYTYHEHANWSRALSPEYRVKGVISTSLTSSLAEVLNLSFSSQGIQVKIRNNQPVSFRQSKDVELRTVSTTPETWAQDIYSLYYYLANGTKPEEFPGGLKAHGGLKDEQRLSDIVLSIKSLANAMEISGLLGHGSLISIHDKQDLIRKVASVYSKKLESAENSSKFDKASTPAAVEKAKKTKLMLAKYRNEITKLLLN